MTTTNLDEIAKLIRRLLESFTDHHRDLDVRYKAMNGGRVDFRLAGNINDQGKLVGRKGAHINAVKFILVEIGANLGLQVCTRLAEANEGQRLPPTPPRVAPDDYSPQAVWQLLTDLLAELLEEPPVIEVISDGPKQWTFRIKARRIQDYERLAAPVEDDPTNQLLVTSLRVLFTAAGHKDGVIFKIEVPSR